MISPALGAGERGEDPGAACAGFEPDPPLLDLHGRPGPPRTAARCCLTVGTDPGASGASCGRCALFVAAGTSARTRRKTAARSRAASPNATAAPPCTDCSAPPGRRRPGRRRIRQRLVPETPAGRPASPSRSARRRRARASYPPAPRSSCRPSRCAQVPVDEARECHRRFEMYPDAAFCGRAVGDFR